MDFSPPQWARHTGGPATAGDAAFRAGAALGSLERVLAAPQPWHGVWRDRLALRAACASLARAGRGEDEAALRDALCFLRPGDDPGPAGRHLQLWRRVSGSAAVLDPAAAAGLAALLDLSADAALHAMVAQAAEVAAADGPALTAAATVIGLCRRARPDALPLALALADAALARRLRWSAPLPLTAPVLLTGALPAADTDLERAVAEACTRSAVAACDLADALAPRAAALEAVRRQLRAKDADAAIAALLAQDAVTPAMPLGSLSARARRRLFDRLMSLGVVRELSGRASFRIYGL